MLRPLLLGLALVGCAHTSANPAPPVRQDAPARAEVQRAAHDTFLELAAADARFARRTSVQPTPTALARGMQLALEREELVRLLDGAPDPFARAPRERALARADERLQRLPAVPELALLRAVIREEHERFARESELPRDAARLIRALATTPPPATEIERAANDVTLAVRLGEIEDALERADSLDGDAIEDALAELEPQMRLYPEMTKALTSLRLAAGQALPPPKGGRALSNAPDRARWIAARNAIRAELLAWQSAADTVDAGAREERAAELLFSQQSCPAARVPAGLAPSSPRTFGCAALAGAREQAWILKLVVHDLLTYGLWAIELAEDRADYRRVISRYAMQSHVAPELAAKLARRAAAEPEIALRGGHIGAALAAQNEAARAAWIQSYLANGAFLSEEL